MAKDIPMKTCLGEDDMPLFRRYQKMFGSTEAQLMRRAWFFFEDAHYEQLERHEDRRSRPARAPKRASERTRQTG